MNNLNEYQLDNDGNFDFNIEDNSIETSEGITVYFRNIQERLIENIEKADAVFGAVAWLTSFDILDALAKVENVSLIVQKEDFLRPDLGVKDNWKKELRKKYLNLKCDLTRYSFDNLLRSMSFACDPSMDPVRCVGNHNRDKNPAFPRMHNKFVIFSKIEGEDQSGNEIIKPYSVWTGSFNFTKNAGKSLENALLLSQTDVVKAFYKEFGQIAAMSEPLDWESDWAAPEWRIGS